MARTVMAFKAKERTVTQTDIAPSWMNAIAMAPTVNEARMGMNMGLLSGWGTGREWNKETRPGLLAEGASFFGGPNLAHYFLLRIDGLN